MLRPEDNLDNGVIADRIVPTMRVERRRRQFIFSSHIANIPVLGDAEQIVGLKRVMDGSVERTIIDRNLYGSTGVQEIIDLVKTCLRAAIVFSPLGARNTASSRLKSFWLSSRERQPFAVWLADNRFTTSALCVIVCEIDNYFASFKLVER